MATIRLWRGRPPTDNCRRGVGTGSRYSCGSRYRCGFGYRSGSG